MTIYSTKVGNLLRVVSLILCVGCVSLDQPESVKDCLKSGSCSDQTMDDAAGVSNNASETGSDVFGKADLVSTGSDEVNSGSGGITGAGGVMGLDGAPDTSGTARGGATGTGGGLGAGGAAALDAAIGADSATGSGGKSTNTGGAPGSGGAVSLDGAIGTGGKTSSDGPLGTGGHSGTGGTSGTGGATTSPCGATATSTVSKTFNFAKSLGYLSIGSGSDSGSKLDYVTTGPTANPTLCSSTSGCAALSLTYASGSGAYKAFALAVEIFDSSINLVGATVTFSLAVDNPGTTPVPIQIQAYAQGDIGASYAWTQPITVHGTGLDAYAVSTGFKDLSLPVTDYTSTTGQFCSAVTGAIGIQLQNTADITASNAGTVTIYISKITITPP